MSCLNQIIESNLSELQRFRFDFSLSPIECLYRDILYYYGLASLDELKALQPEVLALATGTQSVLMDIFVLRISLLERNARVASLTVQDEKKIQLSDLSFQAEIYFLRALAQSQLEQNNEARESYRRAVSLYRQSGAQRKAVKALNNFVAIESKLAPGKRLIPSYFLVYEEACKVNEGCIAGMALFNISREFEKLGALEIALHKSAEAIKQMESDRGSLHYCMALAHHAQLLFKQGRRAEAEVFYGFLSASDFSEIREIQNVLNYYRENETFQNVKIADLPFMWREKYSEILNQKKNDILPRFSPMEQKLIAALSESPKDKFSLLDQLYPRDRVDFELKEDRLKKLLSWTRKRHPGLISFFDGSYHLSLDSVRLPQEKWEQIQ